MLIFDLLLSKIVSLKGLKGQVKHCDKDSAFSVFFEIK